MNYLKTLWKKTVDALEWRGITLKDLGYVVFCLGSLSMAIALMLVLILSELI